MRSGGVGCTGVVLVVGPKGLWLCIVVVFVRIGNSGSGF